MPLEPSFSYSNAPQPLKPSSTKKKYRDEDEALSLMNDPRVVRGSTYSKSSKRANSKQGHPSNINDDIDYNRKPGAEKPSSSAGKSRGTYDYVVQSFVSADIDLSQYLEEDSKQTKPKMKTEQVQTDEFKERPITPEYIPRKTGIDRYTQVDNVEELFIFDSEVEPLLNVIVSKTIEQALFEVQCEAELLNLENECTKYDGIKLEEEAVIRRIEEETLQEACIKDLTLRERKEKYDEEMALRSKVAGRECMIQILPTMVNEIHHELIQEAVWQEPIEKGVKEYINTFYPQAISRISAYDSAVAMLEELLLAADERVQAKAEPHTAHCLECQTRQNGSPNRSARQELRDTSSSLLKVIIPGRKVGLQGDVEIGPFSVSATDSIQSIEEMIQTELARRGVQYKNFSLHKYLAAAMGHQDSNQVSVDAPLDVKQLPNQLHVVM